MQSSPSKNEKILKNLTTTAISMLQYCFILLNIRKQLSSLENEAVLDIMKPKEETKSDDGKIIGSTETTLQLSESQGQELINWSKAVLEQKVTDIKVGNFCYSTFFK